MPESTLQEIVGMYKPQDNFSQIDTGIKTGAAIGGQMVERQLSLQKMQMDYQYKQQELERQKTEMQFTGLQAIAKEEDPVARKMLADAHIETGKKYGWGDAPSVQLMTKSDDARQQIVNAMSLDPGLNNSNPGVVQAAKQKYMGMFNQTGGDTKKNLDLINNLTKLPEQQAMANTITGRQQQLQQGKGLIDQIQKVLPYAATGEDSARLTKIMGTGDFTNLSTEDLFAIARSSKAYAESTQNKAAAETGEKNALAEKAAAETANIPIKNAQKDSEIAIARARINFEKDKTLIGITQRVESDQQVQQLRTAIGRFDISENLLSNPNVDLRSMNMAQKEQFLAFMRNNRAAIAANAGVELKSFVDKQDQIESYLNSSGRGAAPPAQVKQLLDSARQYGATMKSQLRDQYVSSLQPMVNNGQITQEQMDNVIAGAVDNKKVGGSAPQSQPSQGGQPAQKTQNNSAPQFKSHAPPQQPPSFQGGQAPAPQAQQPPNNANGLKAAVAAILSDKNSTGDRRKEALSIYKQQTGQTYSP